MVEVQQLHEPQSVHVSIKPCLQQLSSPKASLLKLQKPETPNGCHEARRPSQQSPDNMHVQELVLSKSTTDDGSNDSAALFSLEVDDSTQLATVRPRLGSVLLVESMSASQVVLRLQPSTEHSTPCQPSIPSDTVEGFSRCDPDVSSGHNQPEVERVRSTITKEQLSAAQLAVQRSLRGLTGTDLIRPQDADGVSGRDGRSFKRASAPVGSWIIHNDRRGAPSTHHATGGFNVPPNERFPCPPSSAATWTSSEGSPNESTLATQADQDNAATQASNQPRRVDFVTTDDRNLEHKSNGTSSDRLGGREMMRSRRLSMPARAFSHDSCRETKILSGQQPSHSSHSPTDFFFGEQQLRSRPRHQLPVPIRPYNAAVNNGSARTVQRGCQIPGLVTRSFGNGGGLTAHDQAAAVQRPSSRQCNRPSSRQACVPPSAELQQKLASREHQLRDRVVLPLKSSLRGSEQLWTSRCLARPDHDARVVRDPITDNRGRQSIPLNNLFAAAAAAAAGAAQVRTLSAPPNGKMPTEDSTGSAHSTSLHDRPSPAPDGNDKRGAQHQVSQHSQVFGASYQSVDLSAGRQGIPGPAQGSSNQKEHSLVQGGLGAQSAYFTDMQQQQQQQQHAAQARGPGQDLMTQMPGGHNDAWIPPMAHASFYPLPPGSEHSSRLLPSFVIDPRDKQLDTSPFMDSSEAPACSRPAPAAAASSLPLSFTEFDNSSHLAPQPSFFHNVQQQHIPLSTPGHLTETWDLSRPTSGYMPTQEPAIQFPATEGSGTELLDRLGVRCFSDSTSGRPDIELSVLQDMNMLGARTISAPGVPANSLEGPEGLLNLHNPYDLPDPGTPATSSTHHVITSAPTNTNEAIESQLSSPFRPPASMFSFLDGDDS